MKNYNKIILYYFSGTGNSLKAAHWIDEVSKESGIKCETIPIGSVGDIDLGNFSKKFLLGFLAPTHGFNISPSMLKFITNFPKSNGKDIDTFILNTRAGLKFKNLFLPGISGVAQILPMLILKAKGYNIAGGIPLDMPSNWLFLHPGLNSNAVSAIVDRCRKTTKESFTKIIEGKRLFRRVLISLPIDIPLIPITLLYYIFGRFLLSKTMIHTTGCDGCGVCKNVCPVGAISLKGGRPYWSFSCESCMRCINLCPKTSIHSSHLMFLIILFIPSLVLNHLIIPHFDPNRVLFDSFIGFFLNLGLTLIEVAILYKIVFRLLKFTPISRVFRYGSLSNYWRLYLTPRIGRKDFK